MAAFPLLTFLRHDSLSLFLMYTCGKEQEVKPTVFTPGIYQTN